METVEDPVTAALPMRMSAPDFIAWAMRQPEGRRYELVGGRVVAMAPERNRHAIVKANAYACLRAAVRSADLPCTVIGDGTTVTIDDDTVYEPDATVQCGADLDLDAATVDAPTILVDVISPSSPAVDTGRKLTDYFRLPSVLHYLVIDAERRRVIHHARAGDGIATHILADDRLNLSPPGLTIATAALFDQL